MAYPGAGDAQIIKNISWVKAVGDPAYTRDILEARRDYLSLRLKHEEAIAETYDKAAENVAGRIRELGERTGKLTHRHLEELEKNLRVEAERIRTVQRNLMQDGIGKAMDQGGRATQNQFVRAIRSAGADDRINVARLQWGFAQVNTAATEAFWARTHEGLRVSDRIWKTSDNARDKMRDLLEVGIATGRDPVAVARDLEQYVKQGRRTLAEEYPRMMRRMDKRVPKNLNYEALRLVRTEYAKAYHEGVISRGQTNPSYEGVRWQLSAAHPESDVCDDYAEADLYGMGEGIYKKGHEPTVPHPNCLCHIVPVLKDTDEFVDDLKSWLDDPDSVPYMEEWYDEYYRPYISSGVAVGMPKDLKFPGNFGTIEEAEEWAHRKYPNITFDFEGMHVDCINPTLEQFVKLAEDYPEVANRLEYIGGYQGVIPEGRFTRFTGESAHATRDGKRIGLNPKYYGNPPGYEVMLRQAKEQNWSPEGCDTIEAIMTHEFGHQVNNWIEVEGTNKWLTPYAHADGFCQVAGFDSHIKKFQDARRWSPALGGYCKSSDDPDSNRVEMWAEGFSAQYHGTDAVRQSTYVKAQANLLDLYGNDSTAWVDKDDLIWPGEWTSERTEKQNAWRKQVEGLLRL